MAGRSGSAAVANTIAIKVLNLLVNVFTGIITARALGPAGRGASLAMMLWPFVVSGTITFGLPVAFIYHAKREPVERDALLTTALALLVPIGFAGAAISSIFIVPLVLHQYSPSTIVFAQWLMLIIPQIMTYNLLQAYLGVRGQFSRSNGIVLLNALATLAVQLVLVASRKMDPFTNALAYLLPTSVLTFVTIDRVRASLRWTAGFGRRAKRLFRYGIRVYGLDLFSTFSAQIDQTLVIGLMSAANFGLYSLAINLTRMLNIIQTSINVVLFPKAAGLSADESIPLVVKTARVSLFATSLCAAAFAFVLPWLIPALYGTAFASVVPLAQILAVEAVLQGGLSVLNQAFMATGRPGIVTALQTGGLLVSVPVMLVLIPRYGLFGAAFALLAATSLRTIILLACFPLVLKRPLPQLVMTRADFGLLVRRLGKT